MGKRGLSRRFLSLTALLVASVGWVTVFLPPVDFYATHHSLSIGDTIFALLRFKSPVFPGQPAVGWLFLLSTAALLTWFVLATLQMLGAGLRYVERSESTVSVLETRFVLHFEDESLSRTTMTRRQRLHANQPDVTSYPYAHSVHAPHGEIVQGSVSLCSYIDREKITKELIVEQSKGSVEVIEVLDRSLPTSLLSTYLPDWLVLTLFKGTGLSTAWSWNGTAKFVI